MENYEAAEKRYPEFFELTDLVVARIDRCLADGGLAPAESPSAFVYTATIIRAFNLYKSINLLLKTDHWEDAAILGRSLFELLLNAECIATSADADEAARRFLRFELLQRLLHAKSDLEYASRGKPTAKLLKALEIERAMIKMLPEFRNKKNDGWIKWWSGKSVSQLAKDSPESMRRVHYNIIYSFLSDITHSGPYPALIAHLPDDFRKSIEEVAVGHEASERRHCELVITMSTLWLIEILHMCREQIVDYDTELSAEALRRIRAFYA